MDLFESYKAYLTSGDKPASLATVKNYLADAQLLSRWYESTFKSELKPQLITNDVISSYIQHLKSSSASSSSSIERRVSSLRKFVTFLNKTTNVSITIFDNADGAKAIPDAWRIAEFATLLRSSSASDATLKNYLGDVKQFISWFARNVSHTAAEDVPTELLSKIDDGMMSEYVDFLSLATLSPASINRKLSSLRRYLGFIGSKIAVDNISPVIAGRSDLPAGKQELSAPLNEITTSSPPPHNDKVDTSQGSLAIPSKPYSSFAPLRMFQKMGTVATLAFDASIVAVSAVALEKMQYLSWILLGKQIFSTSAKSGLGLGAKLVSSFKLPAGTETVAAGKSLFTNPIGKSGVRLLSQLHPTHPGFAGLPVQHRILGHAKYTRPSWYKKYHSHSIVHYFHFAALILIMGGIGFGLYRSFVETPQKDKILAAAPTAPPRILSFQGRLTDSNDNPITSAKDLRFAIYNSDVSTGAALLWQETQYITADVDGIFSVLLGSSVTIPASVFNDNSGLYLGITVQSDSELTPRQQIATVAFAANSETLQGLYPITAGGAGTNNVVLALDSSGNLTIGGSATPTFSATGGAFTLSGTVLNLQTTSGSNSNININPDGRGLIEIQKPARNSTLNNNIPSAAGSVEIDDMFAVLATSAAQNAVTFVQAGAGPIFSASAGATTRFLLANNGTITASGYSAGVAQFNSTGVLSSSALNLAGGASYITGSLPTGNGGTGIGTYSVGDILYASGTTTLSALNIGASGRVLTVSGGIPAWIDPSGLSNSYWQRNLGALSPANITDDLLLGATSTSAARFAFINNIGSGTPTASISSNFSIQVPTGGANAAKIGVLNGGSLGFTTSVGGDAGATERLTILNGGNVGVGTTIPTQKLEVLGIAQTSGGYYISSSGVSLTRSSNDLIVNVVNAAAMRFNTTNLERMRIDAGGNLGIGTTAPLASLDVRAVNGTTSIASISGLTSNAALAVDNNGVGDIFAASKSGSLKFVIKNSGNIGIGTSLPGYLFDLQGGTGIVGRFSGRVIGGDAASSNEFVTLGQLTGGAGYWQLNANALSPSISTYDLLLGATSTSSAKFGFINNAGGTPTATISSNFSIQVPTGGANAAKINILNGGSLGFRTSVGGDAGATERLTILNGGNIGVGTTAPGNLFDIGSFGTSATVSASINANTSYNTQLKFREADDTFGASIMYEGSDNQLQLRTYNGDSQGAAALTLSRSSGNIAIGTTSTSNFKLKTAGSIGPETDDTYDLGSSGKRWRDLYLGPASLHIGTDLNEGIIGYNLTDNYIGIDADGNASAESVFTDAGNLGIGTTNPATFMLEVAGSIGPTATNTYDIGSIAKQFNNTYTQNLYINGSLVNPAGLTNYWQRDLGAVSPANITDDLLIGGSATSSASFQVYGVGTNAGTASSSGQISFRGTTDPKINVLNGEAFGIRTSAGGDAGLAERFTILNNGNVGIGSSTPVYPFDMTNSTGNFIRLKHASSTTPGYIDNSSTGSIYFSSNVTGADVVTDTSKPQWRLALTQAQDSFTIQRSPTGASWVPADLFYMASDGNIGLGTTTTSGGKIYAYGSATSNTTIATGHFDMKSGNNSTPLFKIAGTGTADLVNIVDNTTEVFTILDGGNVGIGSTAPNAPLDVTGDIYVSSGISTYQTAVSNGTIEATKFCTGDGESNCTTDFSTLTNYWQLLSKVVSPANSTFDLAIGGTATSSAKFQVFGTTNGTITAGTASTSGDLTFNGTSATQNINILKGSKLNFRTASTGQGDAGLADRMTLASNGNVGIGSTTPGARLDLGFSPSVPGNARLSSYSYLGNLYSSGAFVFGYNAKANETATGNVLVANTNGSVGYQFIQIDSGGGIQFHAIAGSVTAGNVASSERMRINPNGNVGIGTTAPVAKLDLEGSTTLAQGQALFQVNQLSTGDILTASASGTTRFVLNASGNLGLNNINPRTDLAMGTDIGTFNGISIGAAANRDIRIGQDSTHNLVMSWKYNATAGNAYSVIENYAGNNMLGIQTNGGNVGIGTTTTTATLELTSTTAPDFKINSGASAAQISLNNANREWWIQADDSPDLFAIEDRTAGNLTRLAINGSGNVGIGTTTPVGLLHLDGRVTGKALALLNETGNQDIFTASASGTPRFVIRNNGNVGIGTMLPGAPLDVVGDIYGSSGISLYNTAVSDDTVEAAQFCTGDGETNCVTDFSSLVAGSSYWVRTSGNLSPTTLNDTLSATSAASTVATFTTNNPGGTLTNNTLIQHTGAGTVANLLNLTQSAGTATNALAITGTFTNLISTPTFVLNNAGAASGLTGLASSGTIAFTGAGSFTIDSSAFDVTSGGAVSGITTLTSSGSTTIGTGASSANTIGAGASSTNIIGSVTTPGALTLHGATTLDNTFTVSGSNLTSLGGNLTVTGTAWTATPTISGLITATSGLTANGAITANNTFTLGDNGDTGSINTSDWDIDITGVMTGISGITSNGGYTQSGSTQNTFTGNIDATSGLDVSGANLTVADDLYVSSGISTFATAVSNGTIEATQFCTGDGETNCVTDFSSLVAGASYWKKSAGNLSPFTLNDTISATTSAAVALTLTQTGAFNALLVEDQASDASPFIIDQSGNVGIGTTAVTAGAELDVVGDIVLAGGGTFDTRAAGTLSIGTATQTGLTVGRAGATTTINGSSLTVGPTAWTATPTISGLITATSGLTSNGTLTVSNGQTLTAAGVVTLGDGGDNFSIASNALDVSTAGVISGATGLTSSGTINFSGLSASQAVFTDGSDNLVSNAITGSGNVVMSTSPTMSTSIVAGTASFDLLNTVATTINFAGAASTLNIGPGSTTATSVNLAGGSAATGCTVDGATGDLTCSGVITGSGGALTNLWQRIAGNLSPVTLNDTLSATSAASTVATFTTNNPGGTLTNNTLINHSGAGTVTNLLNLTQSAGTVTNAISTTGTFGNVLSVGGTPILNATGVLLSAGLSGTYSNTLTLSGASNSITAGTLTATGGSINGTTIGASTPSTGAFTTLTSSGATTLGTGASLTNTFGSGASSVNTIGAVTTPGALTLHGATTLDNTFTVSGSNLTSLGGNLTVTGTAWTATPTISGLITATSGVSVAAGQSYTGAGAVTLSSGGAAGLTLDSASNTLTIASSDTTLTASGLATISLGTSATINAGATGLNLQADGSIDVNLAGGSGATGCTIANSTGNIVCAGTITGSGGVLTNLWQRALGALAPINITDDLLIGGSASSSSTFQVLALSKDAGAITAGTASTSGDLTFRGTTSDINLLGNAVFNIKNSIGGDAGLVTRLTLAANGNLGIGTTTPIGKLHLEGAATGRALATFNETGGQDIFTASASGTPRFVIKNGGNVGIGTILPGQLLSVAGFIEGQRFVDSSNNNFFIDPAATGVSLTTAGFSGLGTQAPVTYLHVDGATTLAQGQSLAILNQTGASDIFTASTSGTTRFLIRGSGNVGVGSSTNPLGLFSVNGLTTAAQGQALVLFNQTSTGDLFSASTSGTTRFTIKNSGNVGIGNISNPLGLLNLDGATTTAQGQALAIFNQTGTADIFSASASGSTRFVINNGGNVGIGTTAPGAKLVVSGTTSTSILLNNSGGTGFFQLQEAGTTRGYLGYGDAGSLFTNATSNSVALRSEGDLYLGTGAVIGLSLDTTGNVGIGSLGVTSSFPRAALDISGNASMSGDMYFRGSGTTIAQLNGGHYRWVTSPGGTSSLTERMRLTPEGNVGINTTTPGALLEVSSSNAASKYINLKNTGTGGGDVFMLSTNTSSSLGTPGFVISSTDTTGTAAEFRLDFTNDSLDLDTTLNLNTTGDDNERLCHTGADGAALSSIRLEDCTVAGEDFAEWALVEENNAEPGDIVYTKGNSPTDSTKTLKALSHGSYQLDASGIISTNPFIDILGDEQYKGVQNAHPIALTGRIPVKISLENGPILVGDPLVPSSIPGVAMKGTRAGIMVGLAEENYDGSVRVSEQVLDQERIYNSDLDDRTAYNSNPNNWPNSVGKIMTSMRAIYFDPSVQLAHSGNLNISGYDQGSFEAWAGQYKFQNKAGFAEAIIAELTTGIVKTQQLVVNGSATFLGAVQMQALSVAGLIQTQALNVGGAISAGSVNAGTIAVSNLSIGGQALSDYILSVVSNSSLVIGGQGGIISPVADIDRINTNVISPLATGEINIDGNVKTKNLSVNGDASVSGTLRADKIIANDIEGLNARIASIAANTITASSAAITNIYNNTYLASGSAVASGGASMIASSIDTNFANIGSLSANLAYVPSLTSDFGTFSQGLMSFGATSLADTSIAGQLSVNGSLILADNTINTLGSPLEIQPLRQGALSFMGGLVAIDIDGNLSVAGNATFAKDVTVQGTLAANIISPVPNEDLILQLPGFDDGTTLATNRPGITVKNGSGSAVLKITDVGDIIASGAALASQFQVVRGAQADTSLITSVATASAGTATIKAGQLERTIQNSRVTADSLIYITATSDTSGKAPFVARQVAEDVQNNIKGSFTVRIPQAISLDAKVNWWIIN